MSRRAIVVDTHLSPFSKLRPVPVNCVRLRDNFWAPRIDTLVEITLPAVYSKLEESGALNNFRRISHRTSTESKGFVFADEHVYKWLEATVWALAYRYLEDLVQKVKEVVDIIETVQEPDGYVNTRFYGKLSERYRDLSWSHELYVGGHLIQAAIACRRTGICDKLFYVGEKYANHVSNTFGYGKNEMADGHPNIEMALVELYRETRNTSYLDLARFFIDARGSGRLGGSSYFIDNKPFKQLEEVPPGAHAVRFLYLVAGTTDIYIESGDGELWSALEKLWNDLVNRKMYITGGVGSRHEGEAIGEAYELPNDRAYAETCAAVASIMWNYRMLLATGNARYSDIIELTLYNAALSGISFDGKHFFYVNPLADRGKHRRQPWFPCPCCPPNIARLLATLPSYFYSTSDDGIWIHLYASNDADIEFRGRKVKISQDTPYPWEGKVTIKVNPESEDEFALYLRVPGWTRQASVTINGERMESLTSTPTYLKIERLWRSGDTVELNMDMEIEFVASNPMVIHNTGRVTIKRGPLVYCLEQVDNPGVDVWNIALPPTKSFMKTILVPDFFNGIVVIEGSGYEISYESHRLYTELEKLAVKYREIKFKAVPYYIWANREPGPMTVWVPLIDVYKTMK